MLAVYDDRAQPFKTVKGRAKSRENAKMKRKNILTAATALAAVAWLTVPAVMANEQPLTEN